jgi:hypothetical protein
MNREFETSTLKARAIAAGCALLATLAVLSGIIGLVLHYDDLQQQVVAGRPAMVANHAYRRPDSSSPSSDGTERTGHQT